VLLFCGVVFGGMCYSSVVLFLVVCVTLLFSFLCGVVLYFFVFVLCLVYLMLSVSLNCPFIIDTSVLSNVYLEYIHRPILL
jgi:hypothetical protein